MRRPALFVLTLLVIEFLDELVYSTREAAWPLIRDDLGLTYAQVGLLLSLPDTIGVLIELPLGVLADTWKRRVLVLGGGVVFTLSLLLIASAHSFGLLMLALVAASPASGAFVSLSQATLMDLDSARHDQNMARWTLAGSVGVVIGPLALSAALALGFGWREVFAVFAVLSGLVLAVAWRMPYPRQYREENCGIGLVGGLRNALRALRQREVLRWAVLLECSDLMLDILYGYLALYFVDVVGVDKIQAGVAVAVWTGVGLAGDLLLIPLLEKVRGLTYLRISAVLELALYLAFLLLPGFLPKVIVLGLLGFFNSGWYAILQGRLYTAMPGLSGTAMTVGNLVGVAGSLIPLGIGLAAERFGLGAAMWIMFVGPITLLVGLPRQETTAEGKEGR